MQDVSDAPTGEIVRAEATGIPDADVRPIKSKRESLHSKRAGSNFIRLRKLIKNGDKYGEGFAENGE